VNVTDELGSVLTAPFNYKIAKKKFPTVDMKLGDQFVHTKVPELLESLKTRNPSIVPSGDDYKDFKLVNDDLRRIIEAQVREVIRTSSVKERLWRGVFIRPLAAAPKATFCEKRLYKQGNTVVSESLHMGIDLADVAQAPVHAANRGQVLFTGELGIYGQAIIIDHGTGVASLYGHLSSISVNPGDVVDSGKEIGRTGATGLAGGDHLHFEIRVQGVPVSPFEWLDPLWIRQHVEEKIKTVLAPVEPAKPASSAS
jgi:murein DD-endopeptidase MepM/ murein hydrolase activator NlpD